MAKTIIDLSFSQISPLPVEVQPCEILFTQMGRPRRKAQQVLAHTHPFWQMEIITRGRVHATILHHACELTAGDCLLIPPETAHAFEYPWQSIRWVSLKFKTRHAADAPFLQPILDPLGVLLRDMLINLVAHGQPERATQTALQGALAAFLLHCYPQHTAKPQRQSRVADAVRDYVQRHANQGHSVKDLAARLGYSAGHLSALFQQDSGQPLKLFLDYQRARAAQRLLLYADMSVAEVAATLGFPDIFSFSRFFKRVTGSAPSDFRNCAE